MRGSFRISFDEQLPALTGIRAVAAFLVFFHHYTPSVGFVGAALHRLLMEGHVGVTVFYVLSGFLIAWNYMDKKRAGEPFWGQYILRRVARIQPLYLLLLALTLYLAPAASGTEVLLNATLLKGFLQGFAFTGIPQAWSLTVEETFYIAAPLLFVALRRYGFALTQAALWAGAGVIAVAFAHAMFPAQAGDWKFFASYTFFGRSFEFLAGIYCASWIRRNRGQAPRMKFFPFTWIGGAGALLTVAGLMLLQQGARFGVLHPVGIALNNLVLPLFVGVTLLGLVQETTMLSRLLSTRAFLLLGRSSYAFYLIHFGPPASVFYGLFRVFPRDQAILLLFVAVNVASIMLYAFYEHPANGLVRRFGTVSLGIGQGSDRMMFPGLMRNRVVMACSALALVAAFWGLGTEPAPASVTGAPAPVTHRLRVAAAPEFETPVLSHGSIFTPTSNLKEHPTLTGRVAGRDIRGEDPIFAHANSVLEYDLKPGRWTRLIFSMGLDDAGGADSGSVVYTVTGDGRVLHSSKVVRSRVPPTEVSVDISGVRKLRLSTQDAGDGVNFDESYWLGLKLM